MAHRDRLVALLGLLSMSVGASVLAVTSEARPAPRAREWRVAQLSGQAPLHRWGYRRPHWAFDERVVTQ